MGSGAFSRGTMATSSAPIWDVLGREGWRWREPRLVIRYALKYFARVCDELIDPAELVHSHDPFHRRPGSLLPPLPGPAT